MASTIPPSPCSPRNKRVSGQGHSEERPSSQHRQGPVLTSKTELNADQQCNEQQKHLHRQHQQQQANIHGSGRQAVSRVARSDVDDISYDSIARAHNRSHSAVASVVASNGPRIFVPHSAARSDDLNPSWTTSRVSHRPPVSLPPTAAQPKRRHTTASAAPEPAVVGLFNLLNRSQTTPYHSQALLPSRSASVPTHPSRARRATPPTAPPQTQPTREPRPSPGAYIRYFLAPLVLLPIAWPWLFLRTAQTALAAVSVVAAAAVDALLFLAELLRRHRGGLEALVSWTASWLGWLVVRYWAGLTQLHQGCEEALARIIAFATPLVASALRHSPAAARVLRMLSPVLAIAAGVQDAVYGGYCFLHDEIVPVALDLAERLPLVHGLLHRAVLGSSTA